MNERMSEKKVGIEEEFRAASCAYSGFFSRVGLYIIIFFDYLLYLLFVCLSRSLSLSILLSFPVHLLWSCSAPQLLHWQLDDQTLAKSAVTRRLEDLFIPLIISFYTLS